MNKTIIIINGDEVRVVSDYAEALSGINKIYGVKSRCAEPAPDVWRKVFDELDNGGKCDLSTLKGLPLPIEGCEDMTVSLAAVDAEVLDGGFRHNMTFVFDKIMECRPMNRLWTNGGGYIASDLKLYIEQDVLPRMPSWIKPYMTLTYKTCYNVQANIENSFRSKLWLLSSQEVWGEDGCEKMGRSYKYLFTNNTSRARKYDGYECHWWLRSAEAGSGGYFRGVGASGAANYYSANNSYGLVLGFCISSDPCRESAEDDE